MADLQATRKVIQLNFVEPVCDARCKRDASEEHRNFELTISANLEFLSSWHIKSIFKSFFQEHLLNFNNFLTM